MKPVASWIWALVLPAVDTSIIMLSTNKKIVMAKSKAIKTINNGFFAFFIIGQFSRDKKIPEKLSGIFYIIFCRMPNFFDFLR